MKRQRISGWGNYPVIDSHCESLTDRHQRHALSAQSGLDSMTTIARGNGRSYGDSALNEHCTNTLAHNKILAFDEKSGHIQVQSGVLLNDIIARVVPTGWFLAVVPGTRFVTVGGAVAADIHGKNHLQAGCFSRHIRQLWLLQTDGESRPCSHSQNPDLFRATCGGMGLTGLIDKVDLTLVRIGSSSVNQSTIKTNSLQETLDTFAAHSQSSYAVAWMDCLPKKHKARQPITSGATTTPLGRSIVTIGEFGSDGDFSYPKKSAISWPVCLPFSLLNDHTMKLFNALYYAKVRHKHTQQVLSIDSFFFPLDKVNHWNRIYGKKGFVQYQFVLPQESALQGLTEVLACIEASGTGAYLAVLKRFGQENDNYLSFPMDGYSLALDFKVNATVLTLLKRLDEVVVRFKGRIYLAKDARLSQSAFEAGYPHLSRFKALRKSAQLDQQFSSLQARRLGL